MRTVLHATHGKTYEIIIAETESGVEITPTLNGKAVGRWSYSVDVETAHDLRHSGHYAVDELLKVAKADLDRDYDPTANPTDV